MGFTQATHPVQSSHPRQGEDESVRITAAARHEVLVSHYKHRVMQQEAVTREARNNRDSLTARFRANPESVRPYQIDEANRQLQAARTVEQDVRSVLAAFGNREFRAGAR